MSRDDRDVDSNFLLAYDMDYVRVNDPNGYTRSGQEIILVVMYYMMTTMSTVGFGDIY